MFSAWQTARLQGRLGTSNVLDRNWEVVEAINDEFEGFLFLANAKSAFMETGDVAKLVREADLGDREEERRRQGPSSRA